MIRTIYVLIVCLTYDIVAGFRATFCAPVFQGSFHAFHWFNNSAPGRTYGVLPDGTMRLAGKQENGTADARRCTQMDPNPAWPSRRISKQAFLASLAEAMVPVPSACISVHLRFQFLAFPPAAPGCRGGRSSPRTKPHAPIRHGAARAAPRSPRCTAATRPHAPIRAAVPSARASSVAAEPHAPEAVARPALPSVPPGAHMRRW